MTSQRSKCPYCGIPITGGSCIACRNNEAQLLYDSLIADLQELSMNKDSRDIWYDQAEHLKKLGKELYYKVMTAARAYNKEIIARDRRIKEDDLRCRELALRINVMELKEIAKQREGD